MLRIIASTVHQVFLSFNANTFVLLLKCTHFYTVVKLLVFQQPEPNKGWTGSGSVCSLAHIRTLFRFSFRCCRRGKKENQQPQLSCWMKICRRQTSNLPTHHQGKKHILLLFGKTAAGVLTWGKFAVTQSGSDSEAPVFWQRCVH